MVEAQGSAAALAVTAVGSRGPGQIAGASSMHYTAKLILYSVSIPHLRFRLFRERLLSSSFMWKRAFAKKYVLFEFSNVSIKQNIRKREKWP